ncbi:MAG: hypothetical protein ACAI43_18140 [Phycisphaerae bacterium]
MRTPAVLLICVAAAALSACTGDRYSYRNDDAAAAERASRPVPPPTTGATVVEDFSRFSLAAPTGDKATSALFIEKLSPREARLNRPFDYKLRVTNLTSAVLTDVVVRERLPESFALTRSEPPVASAEGGWARYNLGELGPLAVRTIDVTGVPHAEGTLASAIAVDYKLATRTETSVVNPILKLTKTAPAEADICEGIKYTYVAANVGTGTERGVVLEDRLPEGLVTDDGKTVVKFDVGDIGQNSARELVVRVKPLKTGTYAGFAVARASGGAEVKSNEVSTIVRQPALDVAVSGPAAEYLNKTATYTVTVKNTGDAPARKAAVVLDTGGKGVVASATLNGAAPAADAAPRTPFNAPGVKDRSPAAPPAARDPLAAAKLVGDAVEVGTIAPGESRTVTVAVRATAADGPLVLTARAIASCAAEVSAKATTNVLTLAALRLEVIDLDDPIRVGDEVTYSITVKNQGTGADSNLAVTVTLPPALKFSGSQGPTDATAAGQTLTFAPLETLKPGDTAVWRVLAKATAPGDVRLEVRLKSDSLKDPATETEPTRLY